MATPRAVAAILIVALGLYGGDGTTQTEDFGGYRPHYQGHGVRTRAGRGGAVLKVTNLNDAGPGSLRAALEERGPRIVVFETSGTIQLRQAIIVTHPFLTIAGQTAPSPGITVRDAPVYLDTHDVVVQHVRLRLGDTTCPNPCPGVYDSLYIRADAYNIVLDHLSVSWGTHGNLSISAQNLSPDPREIAILDSIFSEPLAKSMNPFGTGITSTYSATGTWTHARNLHVHQGVRSPWVGPGFTFAGYNNVVYNGGCCQAQGDAHADDAGAAGFMQVMGGWKTGLPFDVAWIGNVNIPGPNTHPGRKTFKVSLSAVEAHQPNRMYLADNVGPFLSPRDQWAGVTYQDAAHHGLRVDVVPPWYSSFRFVVLPNSEVVSHVLDNAGARPIDRDVVDRRITVDVEERAGQVIMSQAQVGGWPALAVNRRSYAVPWNANRPGSCGRSSAGERTVVECDLEIAARALEPRFAR